MKQDEEYGREYHCRSDRVNSKKEEEEPAFSELRRKEKKDFMYVDKGKFIYRILV